MLINGVIFQLYIVGRSGNFLDFYIRFIDFLYNLFQSIDLYILLDILLHEIDKLFNQILMLNQMFLQRIH